jgi:hypothetical protein
MTRNILVRVFDGGGRPVSGAKVSIWVYQFMASGLAASGQTAGDGEFEADIDIDASGEISISVNDKERVSRSSPRGSYRIEI